MRRALITFMAATFALTLGAQAALADSPHFVNGPNYTATTTELTASGKAAGLGNSPLSAQLTADSIVVYFHCVNHGNNFAPGHPATQSPAAGPTQPITPRNGQITFSPTLPAFVPSVSGNCPNKNWKVIVDEVDYLGVLLTIKDANGDVLLSDGPNDFTSCAAGFGACVFTG
jgi:hypothetical protein